MKTWRHGRGIAAACLGLAALAFQSTVPLMHRAREAAAEHTSTRSAPHGRADARCAVRAPGEEAPPPAHDAASCPVCRTAAQGKYVLVPVVAAVTIAPAPAAAPAVPAPRPTGPAAYGIAAPRAPPTFSS